jgi:hypothetical protein
VFLTQHLVQVLQGYLQHVPYSRLYPGFSVWCLANSSGVNLPAFT